MKTPERSWPGRPRAAIGALGCIAGAAVLATTLLLFDRAADTAWAGMDPALAHRPDACLATASTCPQRVAAAAVGTASAPSVP